MNACLSKNNSQKFVFLGHVLGTEHNYYMLIHVIMQIQLRRCNIEASARHRNSFFSSLSLSFFFVNRLPQLQNFTLNALFPSLAFREEVGGAAAAGRV